MKQRMPLHNYVTFLCSTRGSSRSRRLQKQVAKRHFESRYYHWSRSQNLEVQFCQRQNCRKISCPVLCLAVKPTWYYLIKWRKFCFTDLSIAIVCLRVWKCGHSPTYFRDLCQVTTTPPIQWICYDILTGVIGPAKFHWSSKSLRWFCLNFRLVCDVGRLVSWIFHHNYEVQPTSTYGVIRCSQINNGLVSRLSSTV